MRRFVALAIASAVVASSSPSRAQEAQPADPGAAAFGAALGGVLGGVAGAVIDRKLHREGERRDDERVVAPGGPRLGRARGTGEHPTGQARPGGEGSRPGSAGAQHQGGAHPGGPGSHPGGGQERRRKNEGSGQ